MTSFQRSLRSSHVSFKYPENVPAGASAGRKRAAVVALALLGPALAGCTTDALTTGSISPDKVAAVDASAKQKDCLVRAMYFESNRSSEDGMLAVGSVVMNRVASPKFPDSICGVVGQPNQFADGVTTRKMSSSALPKIEAVADEVLAGKRHPKVGRAMFFHTAGLTFPYDNMHYVVVAGGNAFYEKIAKSDRVAAPAQAVAANDVASPPASEVAVNVPLPAPRPDDQTTTVVKTAFAEGGTADQRVEQAFASFAN